MWWCWLLATSHGLVGTGRVGVRVTRVLDAAPAVAADAWLKAVWRDGGGLPIAVVQTGLTAAGARQRLLLPALLEETLTCEPSADETGTVALQYVVSGSRLRLRLLGAPSR